MERTGKVRLVDIAREVGASVAAVSKVLGNNNCSSIGVRKEMVKRIRECAVKYNYIPNLHARALVGHSSKLIGVLVDSRMPPVMARMLAELERFIAKAGYTVITVEAHENIETLYKNYKILKQYGVDGVIFMSHEYEDQIDVFRKLFNSERNIVYQGIPHLDGPFIAVNMELSSGIRAAVEYLRKNSRKRIALLLTSSPTISTIRSRMEGYESAVPENERFVFKLTVRKNGMSHLKSALDSLIREKIIPEKIDALIMQNDFHALTLLSLFAQYGIRVPDDIAIVGHDNEPFTECTHPELTTIDQAVSDIAKTMVEELMRSIASKDELTETRIIHLEPKLIIRKST